MTIKQQDPETYSSMAFLAIYFIFMVVLTTALTLFLLLE